MSARYLRSLWPLFLMLAAVLFNGCSGSSPSTDPVSLSVSGRVAYEDRLYGLAGFTGLANKAVRYARVEVVDAGDGKVLGVGVTNSSGNYYIALNQVPGGATIYARAISETSGAGAPPVEVRNLSNALYAVASQGYAASAGANIQADISISVAGGAGGAFNILDVFTSGGEFVNSLAGTNPALINAYWQPGSNGTYYCTGGCPLGDGIYVLGGQFDLYGDIAGDTDEYDDDVLMHEYGHAIAEQFSEDHSPGGPHSFEAIDLDLRLAWSEGWSDHMPGAIKAFINSTDPARLSSDPAISLGWYLDTVDGLVSYSLDMADPVGSPYYGAANEAAVAKVLLRMGDDLGEQAVWDVFTAFALTSGYPANLEKFWDSYLLNLVPPVGDKLIVNGIYAERGIYYVRDQYEPDGDMLAVPRTFAVNAIEYHTLYEDYLVGDADIIAFDAEAGYDYIIETVCPSNGADTYLTLADNTWTTLAVNDDWPLSDPVCPDVMYSDFLSRIRYTVTVSGTYHVMVTTAGETNIVAGRYGNYRLRITRTPTL